MKAAGLKTIERMNAVVEQFYAGEDTDAERLIRNVAAAFGFTECDRDEEGDSVNVLYRNGRRYVNAWVTGATSNRPEQGGIGFDDNVRMWIDIQQYRADETEE